MDKKEYFLEKVLPKLFVACMLAFLSACILYTWMQIKAEKAAKL